MNARLKKLLVRVSSHSVNVQSVSGQSASSQSALLVFAKKSIFAFNFACNVGNIGKLGKKLGVIVLLII